MIPAPVAGVAVGVGLDRIILTADTACVPTGTGDNCAASTTVTPTPTPTATPATGAGIINNPSFTYAGTWQTATATDAYQGDEHYSSTADSTYTVNFTGTQLKLYATKNAHHGIAAISVDGGAETNVDFYAANREAQALVYTSPVLTNGAHTVRIRVTGTKNAASTGLVVTADRADVVATITGDLNGDGVVNVFDLSLLLSSWGTATAKADVNKDGAVNVFDLSLMLTRWTP